MQFYEILHQSDKRTCKQNLNEIVLLVLRFMKMILVVRKYKQNLNYCASLMFLSSPGKSKLSFLLAEESIYFSNNCICDDNNENTAPDTAWRFLYRYNIK